MKNKLFISALVLVAAVMYALLPNISYAADDTSVTISGVALPVVPGDSDQDSIPDAVENAAPNDGDNNYDGVVDGGEGQSTVATTTNPNDTENPNAYVTLQVGNPQMVYYGDDGEFSFLYNDTPWEVSKFESIATPADQPDGTIFPLGLFNIQLRCNGMVVNGACATWNEVCMTDIYNECYSKTPANLKLIFDRVMDTSKWTMRKYDPTTGQYIDYSDQVTIQTENIGYDRTTVSWVLYDGEPGDEDGLANGLISDPIGPSVPGVTKPAVAVTTATTPATTVASTVSTSQAATLAQTGVSTKVALALAIVFIVAGVSIFAKDLRTKN